MVGRVHYSYWLSTYYLDLLVASSTVFTPCGTFVRCVIARVAAVPFYLDPLYPTLNGHSSSNEQVREALNQRLRASILRDWTHSGDPHAFNSRWTPYASHTPAGPNFNEFPSPRDGTIT